MQHFIGDFDGTTFRSDNPPDVALPSTGGPDDYAAVSWSDVPAEDGRRLWIGWMSHWGYAGRLPTPGWKGAMTVPRRLRLMTTPEGVRLRQTPVHELEALRGPSQSWQAETIAPDRPLVLPIQSESYEIIAEFEAGDADAFGLSVRQGGEERTLIGYDCVNSVLFVDRTRSGVTDFHPRFGTISSLPFSPSAGRLKLHLFVDRCSVEVFADDGAAYMAALIFPSPDSRSIEIYAREGTAHLRSMTLDMTLYPMLPV